MFTLAEYRSMITVENCPHCHVRLPATLSAYYDENGWPVVDVPELVWLFLVCMSCGRGWPISELGVPRFPVELFEVL